MFFDVAMEVLPHSITHSLQRKAIAQRLHQDGVGGLVGQADALEVQLLRRREAIIGHGLLPGPQDQPFGVEHQAVHVEDDGGNRLFHCGSTAGRPFRLTRLFFA